MNDDRSAALSGTEIAQLSQAPGSPDGGSTAAGTDDGGAPAPGSGARRRRRRGGRGRGGRGSSGSGAGTAATAQDGAATTSARTSSGDDVAPAGGRGGSGRAERPNTDEQPEVDLDAQPGEVERAPTGPRPAGTRAPRTRARRRAAGR